MVVIYIINWVFSIAFAISCALLLTAWIVKKSNDIGDSKGKPTDFAQSFKIIRDDDNLTGWKDRDAIQRSIDQNEFWFSSDYRGYQ